MNLLLALIAVSFVFGIRRGGRTTPMRTVPLIVICTVFALAYLSQSVI